MPSGKTFLTRKPGLYLKDVPGKGRGVFCTKDIKKGETLEVTPAIILNEKETLLVDKTRLENYTFLVENISRKMRKEENLRDIKNASAVLFGVVTFCNHADRPNADLYWEEKDGTLYYILEALRAIPKNTEICTSYGKGWFEDRKNVISKA